jgi:hypothetical protein
VTPCSCQWEERCGGTRRLDCFGCSAVDAPCSCPCGGWRTCLGCKDCELLEEELFDYSDERGDA